MLDWEDKSLAFYVGIRFVSLGLYDLSWEILVLDFRVNGIDFEEVRIDLVKRQHRSPEFKGPVLRLQFIVMPSISESQTNQY